MFKLVLVTCLIALAACQSTSSLYDSVSSVGRRLISNDTCFKENLIAPVYSIISRLTDLRDSLNGNTTDSARADRKALMVELVLQLSRLREIKELCNVPNYITSLKNDIPNEIGVGLLLASQCMQDLGYEFLVVDSIIKDWKDIENDVFSTIVVGVLGYKGYGDCKQLVDFFRMSAKVNPEVVNKFLN
jgi:hypothetical protein